MKRPVILMMLIQSLLTIRLDGQFVTPTVTGNFNVGSVLNAGYTGSPASGDTIMFEWYYSPVRTLISTSATYTILSSDQGRNIYLKVIEKVITPSSVVKADSTSASRVNSFPLASNVVIAGETRSNMTIYGVYVYSDADNDIENGSSTVYRWFTGTNSSGSGKAQILSAASQSYKLTDSELGKYIGFSVTPAAAAGSTPGSESTTVSWIGPVINSAPVAGTPVIIDITGSTNFDVNDVLTANYSYSDVEGDEEDGSVYQWLRSPDTDIAHGSVIGSATAVSYKLALADTGRFIFFRVIPKAKTGNILGSPVTSGPVGKVNTPPYATSVYITGTTAVGNWLTGHYTYHHAGKNDEGTSIFRWLRSGVPISGATSLTYFLVNADEDDSLKFEVTPLASSGYPDKGSPNLSASTTKILDTSTSVPEASNVCIDGKRMKDSVLTANYLYTYSTPEGTSHYKWYIEGVEIPGETSINYTVKESDLTKDIVFEVTPRSSNNTPRTGTQVMSKSLARITMLRTNFITTDKDTILSADPPGGYFWGDGVLNGKFSPKSVDYNNSPFKVTYHLNDYSCSEDAITNIYVNNVTATFHGINNYYCQNGNRDTIRVSGIPAVLTIREFSYSDPSASIIYINDSTIIIDPKTMRAGNGRDILTFHAKDIFSFINLEISQPLVVDAIQPITINLADNSVFCNNDPKTELYVNQAGGVYTGPVSGGYFDPSLATGNTAVGYSFTTKLGCVSSISVPITIYPVPAISFAAVDSCISDNKDVTKFINNTTSADSVSRWWWEFSDAGVNHPDSIMSPGYLYVNGGFHKITLTATTIHGCVSTDIETIELINRPHADFYWKNECKHASDSIMLFDSTTSSTKITSRSWNFFDGDSLHTVLNPHYPQGPVGYLAVEYTVRTKYKQCFDTRTKNIYIRPTKSLAKDPYFENFESGNGSWIKNYEDTLNTWSFGKPSRPVIDTAASGNNAWFTNYTLTNEKKESSSIISPCFNFDSIQRPMISMKLWTRFDKNRDGAALQYKVGDEKNWQYVGSFEDGINWYNSTLIQGRPGGDQMIGWTLGTKLDKGWGEARHKLDDLAGKKDVKFRVAYGSNGTAQENDGIAFDDVWIGRRTRGVLLEHFTNITSLEASTATEMVSDLSTRWPADIINIQYHTNFPGIDPYYSDNPGDASARLLSYGLSRAPYTFIDGGNDKDNFATLFDYIQADLDSNDVNRRSMINPYFQITLNGTVSSGVVSVTGQLNALQDIDVSNVTLYLVVTQKKSTGPAGANGETEYYNVFRKFIPDAGGITLNRTWAKNDTYTLAEKSWVISNIPNGADIEIITFIQNNITKDVYQAESVIKPNITVGIDDLFMGNGKEFALFPNPASSKLTIAFENPLTSPADIRIYDYSGTLVKTFNKGAGGSDYVIEDLGLKNGIYLIRISSAGIDLGFKKLIVSDR